MNSRHQRGSTLIELLVASIIALVIGSALLAFIQNNYNSQNDIQSQNVVTTDARRAVDRLADHLRNAQVKSGASQVLSSASATDVTYYTSGASSDGTPQTASTFLVSSSNPGMQNAAVTLSIKYFKPGSTSGSYNGGYVDTAANWTQTTNYSTDLPNIGAIQITATVTVTGLSGFSRKLTSFVRLRNSPVITST